MPLRLLCLQYARDERVQQYNPRRPVHWMNGCGSGRGRYRPEPKSRKGQMTFPASHVPTGRPLLLAPTMYMKGGVLAPAACTRLRTIPHNLYNEPHSHPICRRRKRDPASEQDICGGSEHNQQYSATSQYSALRDQGPPVSPFQNLGRGVTDFQDLPKRRALPIVSPRPLRRARQSYRYLRYRDTLLEARRDWSIVYRE
jgi:hypothetical protein